MSILFVFSYKSYIGFANLILQNSISGAKVQKSSHTRKAYTQKFTYCKEIDAKIYELQSFFVSGDDFYTFCPDFSTLLRWLFPDIYAKKNAPKSDFFKQKPIKPLSCLLVRWTLCLSLLNRPCERAPMTLNQPNPHSDE